MKDDKIGVSTERTANKVEWKQIATPLRKNYMGRKMRELILNLKTIT